MAQKKPYRPGDDPLDSFFALSAPQRAWRILRPAVVFLISLALALSLAVIGFNVVMNRFYRPVDEQNETPVVVTVKKELLLQRHREPALRRTGGRLPEQPAHQEQGGFQICGFHRRRLEAAFRDLYLQHA